jgi:hypothetical protein
MIFLTLVFRKSEPPLIMVRPALFLPSSDIFSRMPFG